MTDLNWFYLYVADDHRYFVGPFATRDDAAKAATSDPDVTTINLILHHATEPWCEPMTGLFRSCRLVFVGRTAMTNNYRVTLLEHVGEEPPCYLYFECYADDDDHALEQAMNAYPEGLMIELERTPPNYIRRGISDGHATGHHYARTSGGRHHAEQ